MKIAATIARYLMGLIFTVFGLNGFLQFIPAPPLTGLAGQYVHVLFTSGYMVPVFLLQIVAGVLFVINRYVPLALTLIAPVIFNILLYHILMDRPGIVPGIVVAIGWFLVFASVRSAFDGILRARVPVRALHVCFWMVACSAQLASAGQLTSPLEDGRCAERLRLPDYPILGIQARIYGEVRVVVHLDERSAASDVLTVEGSPHPILYKAVLEAIRESNFAAACQGKSIKLSFDFSLEKTGVDYRRPAKLFFGYPNRFHIVAYPLNLSP